MQDTTDPESFVETWSEASWTRHLRHHARVTAAEKALQARMRGHLAPGTVPEIHHLATPAPGAIPKPPEEETKT